MTEAREHLIKALVAELRPVKNAGDTSRLLALWISCTVAYSIAIVFATGGWRPGAFAPVTPALFLEALVAVAAIATLAHAAFRSAIPSQMTFWERFALPMTAVGFWLLLHVAGALDASAPPSMLGKREACFWPALLFSVPGFVWLLWLLRGLLPLTPRPTAAAAGAAAGALPAILLQFACMYDPLHALTHHLTPILVLAGFGALVGRIVLVRPTRASVRRE